MTDQVEETLFEEEVKTAEDQPVAKDVQDSPKATIPEGLDEWIGEGKKYATVEDALRSIPPAQSFIDKMKDENAEEREKSSQLSQRMERMEEVLEAISKKPADEGKPPLTQEELDELIENKLTLKEQNAIAEANVNNVKSTLLKEFGDVEKATEAYRQKAEDLGIPVSEINALSAKSPNAVYAMFGLTPKSDSAPDRIKSDVNSEASVNNVAPEEKPKSVMGSSTHKDDIAAWKAAAPTS